MTCKEKSDRLIEVTTWAGLTVFDYVLTNNTANVSLLSQCMSRVSQSQSILSSRALFVLLSFFFFVIVFSVLRFMASTYPFGIFKLHVDIMYNFCYSTLLVNLKMNQFNI